MRDEEFYGVLVQRAVTTKSKSRNKNDLEILQHIEENRKGTSNAS
jgi:hypothetical protein